MWQGGEPRSSVERMLNDHALTCAVHTAGALVKVSQVLLVLLSKMLAWGQSTIVQRALPCRDCMVPQSEWIKQPMQEAAGPAHAGGTAE